MRRTAHRLRVDGTLPKSTSQFYRRIIRAKSVRLWGSITCWLLPPVGGWVGPGKALRLVGRWRRWRVAEDSSESSYRLGLSMAEEVSAALTSAGVEHFLTSHAVGTGFGVPAEEKESAAQALRAALAPGWYVSWTRAGRTHSTLLRRSSVNRLKRANEWRLFRLARVGETRALGFDEAVRISFWEATPDGPRERIGLRGLHRFDHSSVSRLTERIGGLELPGLDVFPVESELTRITAPVDFVYTWVDGSDPDWLANMRLWLERTDQSIPPDSAHQSRFESRDELRYSLRSVWAYAGWFRRIFVVTADQVPDWLESHDRIEVVSHRDILPSTALPTFNSHAIEAALHRIPGLSEHYVYMNDDVFLARPLTPHHFFATEGILRFTLSEASVPSRASATDPSVDSAAANNRRVIERLFDRKIRYKLDHAPHPALRSVNEEMESRIGDDLERTRHNRFRSPNDLSVASGLSQFYAAATGRAVPGGLENLYLNLENRRSLQTLEALQYGDFCDSFCLNRTESPAGDDSEIDRTIASGLGGLFGVAAPWERKT